MAKMTLDELYTMRRGLREIDNIRESIARLEARRVSPKVAVYGSETVRGGTMSADVQLDTFAKIDGLIAKYNAKIDAIMTLQARFEKAIESLTPYERVILRKYFLHGMSWEQICVQEERSYRQIMRIWRTVRDQLFTWAG